MPVIVVRQTYRPFFIALAWLLTLLSRVRYGEGIPLPLIGMTAYGVVFLLDLNLGGWKMPVNVNQTDGRLLLLSLTGSMATANAYLLYILSIRFGGALSCTYCLGSAILSFSLFFIILKEFGLQELQKIVALPLFTAAIVLGILSTAYSSLYWIRDLLDKGKCSCCCCSSIWEKRDGSEDLTLAISLSNLEVAKSSKWLLRM